jgi:hypothetical protein
MIIIGIRCALYKRCLILRDEFYEKRLEVSSAKTLFRLLIYTSICIDVGTFYLQVSPKYDLFCSGKISYCGDGVS